MYLFTRVFSAMRHLFIIILFVSTNVVSDDMTLTSKSTAHIGITKLPPPPTIEEVIDEGNCFERIYEKQLPVCFHIPE